MLALQVMWVRARAGQVRNCTHLSMMILICRSTSRVDVEAGKQAESGGKQAGVVVKQHFQQRDQQPALQLC